MRFSEKWLREWTDPKISTEELCAQLTMAGLEVDAADSQAPDFDGVVIGLIVAAEQHPDADRLRICRVDAGGDELLQIVCGAPNARAGLRAPLATVGAKLPGDLTIRRSKLRGIESQGMLCSPVELGLGDAADGLMELPSDAPVGMLLADYLGLDDTAIEVDLTPNRGDCLGVAGIAREVGVLNRTPVSGPEAVDIAPAIDESFPITLEAPEGCPRYLGRVIRNIDPAAQTPIWMQERLRRSGLRSLGPLVDVTNYVMLELGQPMHAFDLRRLKGGIIVRWAREGEKITLLDGREIALDSETLVIADSVEPVAIAGIMGGELSGVADDTDTLFLESAFFVPTVIAGRARRYGMHTDASHRFERGVDPELQRRGIERATELLLSIVGGAPGPVVEAISPEHLPERRTIRLRRARIRLLLGIALADDDVEEILARLGMQLVPADGGWDVTAPSYRFDITIEADLIEELVRIHGYAQLPNTRPRAAMHVAPQSEHTIESVNLAITLVERGYHEAITFSFVDPNHQRIIDPEQAPIALANPISSDLAVMRTTLWIGLLNAVAYNQRRQQERVRLFETGLRYLQQGDEIVQDSMIAGAVCGDALPEQWGEVARKVDFFDVKADVEALLTIIGNSDDIVFERAAHPALHPGQSARIVRDGQPVGWLGALHPKAAQALGMKGRYFVFELNVTALGERVVPHFAPLSKFPAIRRDIAIVVNPETTAQVLRDSVLQAAGEWLQGLQLFDIYIGEHIDPDKKSVAMGLTLQHPSRTLTDQEVDEVLTRVLERLAEDHNAKLRE